MRRLPVNLRAAPQGNRIWAIASPRNITGLSEDWGTVQQSKHFNTDCAENQVKPQICTEKGRVTWAISCVPSRDNLIFSV